MRVCLRIGGGILLSRDCPLADAQSTCRNHRLQLANGGPNRLETGVHHEAPSCEQRLGDEFRILIKTRPFPQLCRMDVLVGSELQFFHGTLKQSGRDLNRAGNLRLPQLGLPRRLANIGSLYLIHC